MTTTTLQGPATPPPVLTGLPPRPTTQPNELITVLSRLQKNLMCPLCSEIYTEPYQLPCQHTMCSRCVKQMNIGGNVLCPQCRANFHVNEVSPNITMQQMVEFYQQELHHSGSREHQLMAANKDYRKKIRTPTRRKLSNLKIKKSEGGEGEVGAKEQLFYLIDYIKKSVVRLQSERDDVLIYYADQQHKVTRQLTASHDCIMRKIGVHFDNELCMGKEITENMIKETKAVYNNELENLGKTLEELTTIDRGLDHSDHRSVKLVIQKVQLELLQLKKRITNLQMHELEVLSDDHYIQDFDADRIGKLSVRHRVGIKALSHIVPSLLWMMGHVLVPQAEVRLNTWVNRMLLLRDKLWCLTTRGIKIYRLVDMEVSLLTENEHSGIGLTATNEGFVLVAAMDRGLLQFDEDGNYLGAVAAGCFHDVTSTHEHVYAINKDRSVNAIWLHVFTFEDGTYRTATRIKTEIDFSKTTLSCCISNNYLYVCKNADSTVYKIALSSGNILNVYGKIGAVDPGEMRGPSLCGTDEMGRLLFIDYCNHCLQVLEPDTSRWTKVQISGLKYPITAIPRENQQVLVAMDTDFVVGFYSVDERSSGSGIQIQDPDCIPEEAELEERAGRGSREEVLCRGSRECLECNQGVARRRSLSGQGSKLSGARSSDRSCSRGR